MQDRRSFLRNAGLGLLAVSLPGITEAAQPGMPLAPHGEPDEKYWKQIKKAFPLAKENLTYLNNGTMGPSPTVVMEAQKERMDFVNSHAFYGGGEKLATERIAGLINANADEIGMTHNVTEGLNIIAWGIPMKKGDEFIITDQEHVGHALPWLNRARLEGIVPIVVSPGGTAEETLQRIEDAITPRTRVISVPHLPCTTGQVFPVKEISDLARSKGIVSVIDGAHGPGMIEMDVHDIGCDFYASCCHKWMLGPKGTGFIYARENSLVNHEAHYVGAYSGKDWALSHSDKHFDELVPTAHRYYYGTQSSILYHGIGAAVDFINEIGMNHIAARIKSLNNRVYAGLQKLDGIDILTPEEQRSRGGVVSFKIDGKNNEAFTQYTRQNHTILRYVPESGLNCVRVSTHIYNTEEDVDHFLAMLETWKDEN